MDWVLDKVTDQCSGRSSVGNIKVTDYVSAEDNVLIAESMEVLVMPLKLMQKEAKPYELKVFWT